MGRGPPSFRVRTIGLPKQAAVIRQLWPSFDCRVQNGRLICRGEIRPTDISTVYQVGISYRAKQRPRVWVKDPPLERRPSEPKDSIPHTYNEHTPGEERPCLHHPTEWSSEMLLANTIIPWFYEWLAFYEIWHLTGEWYGGGIDHNGQKE